MIPKEKLTKYWEGVSRYYLTQSYIDYTFGLLNNRLPLAAFGKPGLYMTNFISMAN